MLIIFFVSLYYQIYLAVEKPAFHFLNTKKMNNTEIYLKYGVALPETCQKLDWQSKTLFYWFNGKLCDRLRFNSLVGVWFAQPIDDDGLTFLKSENKVDFIPAPQMHEIAPLLPLSFKRNYSSYLYFINHVTIGYSSSKFGEWVDDYPNNTLMKTFIENHHYAQAYAELYLKLKKKGLV